MLNWHHGYSLPLQPLTPVHDPSQRIVADENGWRYYARIALRESTDRRTRDQKPGPSKSVAFYDETGNYVGSAPLFHTVPIWSLSGQEIRAMLSEAIERG